MRNITEYHLSQRQYNDPDGYLFSDREEEWREEKLLWEFMGFFPSPLLPSCQNSFFNYREKFFLGIGCIDGMLLLISKGSSLSFNSMKCSLRDPPITISSCTINKIKIEWKGFWLFGSDFFSPWSLEINVQFYLK